MPRRSELLALRAQLDQVRARLAEKRSEFSRIATFPRTYGPEGRRFRALQQQVRGLEREERGLKRDIRTYEVMRRNAGFERLEFE